MIHLLPFDDIPEAAPQTLAASLHPIFGVPVIPHDPVDLPPSSYDPERRQHAAAQILKGLVRFKTSLTQVERVLGIVSVDLFAPDLNFVFGEADPREGVAVISIARLKPEFDGLPSDEALLRLRILKEAVHELGHTYGLGIAPIRPASCASPTNSKRPTAREHPSVRSAPPADDPPKRQFEKINPPIKNGREPVFRRFKSTFDRHPAIFLPK